MKYGNVDSPDVIDTTCELVHDKFIDDYTKLLLHFDNGLTDSAKNKTLTNVNAVAYSTTSKFGGYSALYTAASSQYFTTPNHADWSFGNADFTLDTWFNPSVGFAANSAIFSTTNYAATVQGWSWYIGASGVMGFSAGSGGGAWDYCNISSNTYTFTIGNWYHIAVVRNGSSLRFYVNGVDNGGGVISGSITSAGTMYIGWFSGGGGPPYWQGYMDETRISKGIARWTANFTPPTQSYDCPLDTQTKLLIHGGGPNNGTTFYDNSTTARTLTTVGTAKFDSAQYKHRVSSILLDGNSDYITAIDSDDWYFDGAFTIDFWFRMNGAQTSNIPFCGQYVSGSNFWNLEHVNGGGLRLYKWDGSTEINIGATWTPSANIWYHIALTRTGAGGTWKFYVDGVGLATSADADNFANIISTLRIGYNQDSGTYLNGWIDEFRISKGINRYSSDFTPPAAPYDSPLTQYVIDGLDGDVDKEYRVIYRGENTGSDTAIMVKCNNDGTANYGYQRINGSSTAASALRVTNATGITVGINGSSGNTTFGDSVIYAKTGKVRTALVKLIQYTTGTTISDITSLGYSWNNTVDNITSLVVAGSYVNTIGVGSRLILLKKRQLTIGTKTGEIDPVGKTYGHWQLIYDNTLTAAKTNVMLSSQMDAYTKLLIHADGADASTAFYDFSNSAHVISNVGSPVVSTAQSKFGGGSLLLNGTNAVLSVADNDDFWFDAGSLTIDFWVRFPSYAAVTYDLVGQYASGASYAWCYQVGSANQLYYAWDAGSIYCSFTPASNTWYHIAIVRTSGTGWYMFINGVQQAFTQLTAGTAIGNVGAPVRIGSYDGSSRFANVYMDEIRISKGIARWTANFTPPTRAYNELDGDRDCVYEIKSRLICTTAGNPLQLHFNYDTASNYGNQTLWGGLGGATTVGASRNVYGNIRIGYANSTWTASMGSSLIYAKSGFVRPAIVNYAERTGGTDVIALIIDGDDWNNTTSKITSILCTTGGVASGLSIGTHIELWRLNL